MTEEKRPLGATLAIVLMAAASFWWLMLAVIYFFGWFWWAAAGYPWAGLLGIIYGIMGIIGLGIAGGLYMGLRQSYNVTLFLSIIFLVFSLPSFYYQDWYGIIAAILWGVVLISLLMPGVKAFFKHETPQTTI